jgi:hypothetical protein
MSAAGKRPRKEANKPRQAPAKKPRAVVDHGALLAESLSSLHAKVAASAEYLNKWSAQGTKGANGKTAQWKFEVCSIPASDTVAA